MAIHLRLSANAIKFTEEGEVELAVLSCEPLDSNSVILVFEVHDTGIGIPSALISELFSLFSQLDGSSTRRHEGSGLGMLSCAALACSCLPKINC